MRLCNHVAVELTCAQRVCGRFVALMGCGCVVSDKAFLEVSRGAWRGVLQLSCVPVNCRPGAMGRHASCAGRRARLHRCGAAHSRAASAELSCDHCAIRGVGGRS